MNGLSARAASDLEAMLAEREERSGTPGHDEAATQRVGLAVAERAGQIAGKADPLPGTRPESVLFFRDSLLRLAVTALRAVDAIDKYDLALHWAEADKEAKA